MPGKLIVFITILVIIVTFIGFNYSNSSNITFWPEKVVYEEVPIFVSFFIMYLIGVISVIPFIVGWRMKNRQNKGSENSEGRTPNLCSKSFFKSFSLVKIHWARATSQAKSSLKVNI